MQFKLCLLRIEGSDLARQFKFLFKCQKESGEELAIEQRLTKEMQNYSNGKHVNYIGLNCRLTTIS